MERLQDCVFALSDDERVIVNNTLLMAMELPASEADYADRVGGTREEVRLLLDGFRGPQSIAPDGSAFLFSCHDLVLLRGVMVVILNEGKDWPGEYSARIGAKVTEGQQLLAELEALME